MKTVAITGLKQVGVLEFPTPKPGPGEILIKIRACALCTFDQRSFHGITNWPKPHFVGHEPSGEIVALGEDLNEPWKIGDHVALRTYSSCGTCYYCRQGFNNQCANYEKIRDRHPQNVALSEYMVLPEFQLFKLEDHVSFVHGALAEPLACVIHSIDKARIDFGDDVVVIGMGIMGLFHVQLAKMRGARVIAIEPDEERRALAKQLGADIAFSPSECDQIAYVNELTEGRGADVVINTTAIYSVAGESIRMLGRLGRGIQYSSQHPNEPVPIRLGEVHNRETELIGTYSPSSNDFRRSVKLINMGAVRLDEVIAHVVPFEEAQRAFELATPGAYRVIITMND